MKNEINAHKSTNEKEVLYISSDDNETDYIVYGGYSINKSDFNRIQFRSPLTEKIVDFAATYEWCNWSILFKKQTHVCAISWYDKYILGEDKKSSNRKRIRKWKNVDDNRLLKGANCIKNLFNLNYLILIRSVYGHFSLIIVMFFDKLLNNNKIKKNDKQISKIMILDSVKSIESIRISAYKKETDRIRRMLNVAANNQKLCSGDVFNLRNLGVICPEVPIQPDGVNCGLYTLKNLEKFGENNGFASSIPSQLKYLKKWYDKCDIDKDRKKLLNVICNLKRND